MNKTPAIWRRSSGNTHTSIVGKDHTRRVRAPVSSVAAPASTHIWKSIMLGEYENAASLRRALQAAAIRVGYLADAMLGLPDFKMRKARMEIGLTVVSVAGLGLSRSMVSLAKIHGRAMELGLQICPAEVAPALRLQYLKQPDGEYLRIGMESLSDATGRPLSFIVANGGAELLLIGGEAPPDLNLSPGVLFVFVQPV